MRIAAAGYHCAKTVANYHPANFLLTVVQAPNKDPNVLSSNEGAVVEERRVETLVGPLAVRVRGQGPTAVLWHSLFVDERSWGRVENELATQRRLVMITGPGHGASGDPGRRYTLDDCAEAARAVLDAVAPDEPVDWLGNAWGGTSASYSPPSGPSDAERW